MRGLLPLLAAPARRLLLVAPSFSRAALSPSSRRRLHVSRVRLSHGIVQHRDTPVNHPGLPFRFTAENERKAAEIIARFPANYAQSAVMPLLTLAQEQNDNWLPLSAMEYVADLLDVPRMRCYEVATFYSMYNREPVGRFHIQLCGTSPCQLCGSEALAEAIERRFGIRNGETTADGRFTLTEVECLGACANAPMIQINHHHFYENLTPQSVISVLEALAAGRPPPPGPQNGQWKAAGPLGKTTLLDANDDDVPKRFRDIDALREQHRKDQDKARHEAAQKEQQSKAAQQTDKK